MTIKSVPGAIGFPDQYWHENYSDPSDMDGIGNAKEHALYLKYLMGIEYIDVSSIIDFGFGLGPLFKEMLSVFDNGTLKQITEKLKMIGFSTVEIDQEGYKPGKINVIAD